MSAEERKPPIHEQIGAVKYVLFAGTHRGLDLGKRVPELMRSRGWPHDDVDLASVLAACVCLVFIGAGGTRVRRPPSAEACGGAWPDSAFIRTASDVVRSMDLQSLLEQV